MSRRQFLRSGSALLAAGLAGCNALQPSDSTTTDSPCPTDVPAAVRADYRGDSRVYCNDGSESADAETVLRPSPRSGSLPDARVEFALENGREDHFNTARWDLRKRVDGTWYDPVVPRTGRSQPSVAPGESHDWAVAVDNAELSSVVEPVEGDEFSARALGGGTYAFLVSGSYGAADDRFVDNEPWVAYAARFSLDGDPLALEPTSSVRDVARSGDTVTVRATDGDPDLVVTVSTRDDAPTAQSEAARREVITEQLYGWPVLRDALAHFEDDVTEVVVETSPDPDRRVASPRSPGDTITVTYQGVEYAVTTELV